MDGRNPAMTTLNAAWTAGRAARTTRRPRVPLLIRAATWAGRTLPSWRRARSAVMQTSAVGAVDYGLFTSGHTLAGWIGLGVGLFVLEALGGEKAQ